MGQRFQYPITLDVQSRRCVVIGGGSAAEHKVAGLLEAGAVVAVVAAALTPGLSARVEAGEATWVRRAYREGDLEGALLAIAATEDPVVNGAVHAEGRARGVLVNAVDDITHCDFAAPSVVRRGDLTISVATGGRAPALARRLREQLGQQFGPEWGELIEVLAGARAAAAGARATVDFPTWAARWQAALDADPLALIREGRADDARAVVRRALAGEASPDEAASAKALGVEALPAERPGRVAIVGAGPGDPELISVRGRALLDRADVVVYDRLVDPSLWAGTEAIDVGKEAGGHRVEQEQINALLVRLAREGKRVVRLKGGDPFVFGRGAEEAEALAEAGIDFEVVPGPTSAVAALAAAGIPVTDRRHASSVAIVTGHCGSDRVDWAGLAASVDTLVVLMGLRHLPEIVARLLAAGRPGDTPAAVVQEGTLPTQRVVTACLAELPAAVADAGVCSPAVIVVGSVVSVRERLVQRDFPRL